MKRTRRKAESTRQQTRPSSWIRIGAGIWKGRRIEVPPGARPTSARAREALFDVLGDSVEAARVLDLYAGSGAVGIEAVSRGASFALLMDRQIGALRRTVRKLDPEGRSLTAVGSSVREGLVELDRAGERFELIFCDPPYQTPLEEGTARLLPKLLSDSGRLVYQRDVADSPPELPGLVSRDRRAYGRNIFHFFEKVVRVL